MKKETIKIQDESGDEKMLWENIGKPAYEKGLLEGRQEAGLFAIIPMSILENKTLSANAKLLYGEIMALSKKSGVCYATNEYMSEMLGLQKTSIPNLLKELSGCGLVFINIERNKKGTYRNIMVSFFNEGGHRSLKRGGIAKQRGGGSLDSEVKIEIDKVEIDNNKTMSKDIGTAVAVYGNSDVNWLLKEFETIMGFKSTGGGKDRIMATHLLKGFSREQLTYMLRYCSTDKFAPRVGSVEKLWYKRGDIIAGIKSLKNNIKTIIV